MTPEQQQEALTLCEKLAVQFEGMRLKPYLCPAGVATIGLGSTDYEDGRKVKLSDNAITEARAFELYRRKVEGFMVVVLHDCPKIDSVGLLAACTDLAYNIGSNAFGGSTLRKVINDGGDRDAIAAQFRRWTRGGGKELPGLVKRREAEIALIC